ncbi:hypothetical protein AOQ84DRAFT_373994 [Glonium stellatum]|uniref:Uncharacterized protein n=1 Tax=Glonium stellatum TaxID=574774 RepID=A0A8E2F6G1_9PEZI|nr:hypothetical protein AOQ84DRAFT_373994 [Glonium stellatum]
MSLAVFGALVAFLSPTNATPWRFFNASLSNVSSITTAQKLSQNFTINCYRPNTPNINLDAQPQFDTSGNWTSLSCDTLRTDLCPLMLSQLQEHKKLPNRPASFMSQTPFSQFIRAVFQQADALVNCNLVDDAGCKTVPRCGTGTPPISPVGALIMESMLLLNRIFTQQEAALTNANDATSRDLLLLALTSMPAEGSTETATEILDVAETVLGLASAGSLSTDMLHRKASSE